MCPEPPASPPSTAAAELDVTGAAQYAAWWSKGWPPVEQVRPDVWSIPVPVPDNPIRYTLCYLLFGTPAEIGTAATAGPQELVVVDPGWDTEPGWTALVDGLSAAGTSLGAVTGIVLTHVHADHHGLTARLAAHSGAWIAMHAAERETLPAHAHVRGTVDAADARWITEQGVPADSADPLRLSDQGIERYRNMAEPDRLLADGDLLPLAGRRIRAIWTPGHTPGHLCLHDEDQDMLLTGDHVLPRISPNIGLQPHVSPSPLGPYLDSLAKLSALAGVEVLPAHEWRFRGLGSRIQQLRLHHQQRCDEIVTVITDLGSCTAWQVTQRLTWSRGWDAVQGFQRRAALAETLAHLAFLVQLGSIIRGQDASGAVLYSGLA